MDGFVAILVLAIVCFNFGMIVARIILRTRATNGELIVDEYNNGHKELYLNLSYHELENIGNDEYIRIKVIRRKN